MSQLAYTRSRTQIPVDAAGAAGAMAHAGGAARAPAPPPLAPVVQFALDFARSIAFDHACLSVTALVPNADAKLFLQSSIAAEGADRIARDPLHLKALSSNVPVPWDRMEYRESGADPAVWRPLEAAGIECGVLAPVQLGSGLVFMLRLSRSVVSAPNGWREEPPSVDLISRAHLWASQNAASLARDVMLQSTPLAVARRAGWRGEGHLGSFARSNADLLNTTLGVNLLAEELQALEWFARGKESWAISQLMDMPEGTVKTRLTKAMNKLGCITRGAAASKAIAMGLITLEGDPGVAGGTRSRDSDMPRELYDSQEDA